MSNENAPRILKHTDDRHVQTRLDYMLIYKSESKAKIVRILETWMDTKYAEAYKGTANSKEQGTEPPNEDLWITMSYDQFSLFVYGTIQHDTIKQQVDELVASKHVERRIHPVYPYGPPQYRLNRELVQKSLDELEIPGNLFDLLPMFVTPRKKRTPQEKYPQGRGKKPTRDPGKIPPPTGETSHPSNNHTENTDNHSKNGGTSPAHDHADSGAPAPTPALVSHPEYGFLWFDDPLRPSLMVVRLTPEYPHPYHSPDEDKRRERIAGWEVEPYLKACGLNVSVIFMHDLGNETTVEAAPSSHDSYSHENTEDTHDNSNRGDLLPARNAGGNDGSGAGSHPQTTIEHSGRTTQSEQMAQRELAATSERVAPAELSTSRGSSAQASGKASARTEKPGKKTTPKPEPAFTPEGRKVYDAWASLFVSPPRAAEKTVDCANDLYARLVPWCQTLHMSCKDLLKDIKGWLYATDPDWYRKKGVTLCDIGSKFESWQSAKTEELERAKRPASTTSAGTVSGLPRWTPAYPQA